MLLDNNSPTGSLDVDRFQKALLKYRKFVDPETKAFPAIILFGRPPNKVMPFPF